MKALIFVLFSLLPVSFQNEKNEFREFWGEPLLITKDIHGVFTYDLSLVDPTVDIIFKFEIIVECPKDTIIIKPGYKKY